MSHDVIMPALGMAQETGTIVAWRKQAGDAVSKGDVLMEVETDKATMEVEALANGFLSDVTGEEGVAIPVGNVIARITDTPNEAAAPAKETQRTITEAEPTPAPLPTPAPPPAPRIENDKRILASPKARRIANERGIALQELVDTGVGQPFHARDVEGFQRVKASQDAPSTQPATAQRRDRIVAQVHSQAYCDMRTQIEAQSDAPLTDAVVWAAFAAGALRRYVVDADIIAEVQTPDPSTARQFDNPDRSGISKTMARGETTTPDFIVRDLTAGRITELQLASDGVPVLTIRRDDDMFSITLDAPAGALSPEIAIGLINGLADRIETPLRHLL